MTVLFCDLVGSTARADGADPEDVQAALAAYHGLVRAVLEGHQGTVEKFIGDAVMAVFGAPVAHEDDAERAVRAGLAILAEIERANEASPGLQVRIGIATGEVLVSVTARPELGESLVAGDVVNIAARLQSSAEPGTVAVGERTHRLTAADVAYAPLAPAVVKGKAAAVPRWRATGARSLLASEPGVRSGTRLVGRLRELAALRAAYDRAVSGQGLELVVVTGEPGVGKSRLLAEFFAWVDSEAELVRWRQARCVPYGGQVSFYPLAQIVKAEAGILDSDGEQAAGDKLASRVAALSGVGEADRVWMTARLAPLVGLAGESGAGQPERFTAWCRFLGALAAEAPLILVVEDAHWADPQFLVFLGHLAGWAEGMPIFVVVTARPEFAASAPRFGAEARTVTRLALLPLSDADTAALLAGLLDASLLEAGLQARLLEQAGGNPLFAEQVVCLLTEQGMLRRRGRTVELAAAGELPVPDSLSALITARLDTLPRKEKVLLGSAAVIGRVFWPGAVATVASRDENEVRASLRRLAKAGFVARLPRSSMAGQAEYHFTHALVRDAAYAGLPRGVRGARHLAAASWLEAQVGSRGDDVAEVVAHHAVTALELAEARGDQDAADSLRAGTARRLARAGDRATALDAAATERYYARAVSLLDPADPERVRMLCDWGHASIGVRKLDQGRRALEEALALAQQRNDSRHAGLAMLWLGSEVAASGDPVEEERLTASAIALLETLPVSDELLQAYHYMAFIHVQRARPTEALEMCRRVLELAPADSNWRVLALTWRGFARGVLGDPACLEDDREAIRLARQHKLVQLDNALTQASERLWRIEGPRSAQAACQEARELSLRRGGTGIFPAAACLVPMFDLGFWDGALAMASQYQREAKALQVLEYLEAYRAAVLCWRGALAEAHQALDPVLPAARKGLLEALVPALAAAVTLAVADGDAAAALSLAEEYENVHAPTAPASWYWGWCYLADVVRACIALGDVERAQRLTETADPRLWRHQLELQSATAALAEASGEPGAERLYRQAAAGWQEYGHQLEHALALLGTGRCRQRAAHPDAAAPLHAARAVFAELGAAAPLAETDRWLGGGSTPSTSAHIA